MKKLTKEYLAPYLTSELLFQIESVDGIDILPFTAMQIKDGFEIVQVSNTDYYLCSDDNDFVIKPILRPISDLTKPITLDGVEQIPIVELAKIAYNTEWFHKEGNYNAVSSAETHGFEYNETGFEMYSQISGGFLPVKNQYALFQYLAKHKFDFMGLIDAGLAVDVNTLEINPYN